MDISEEFLKDLALEAGVVIRNGFNCLSKADAEWKEDNTPVTATDILVNEMVLSAFAEKYPDVCVIAEEGSRMRESDWVVYCDPIDGTVPYVTALPLSTICLCALYKGIPTVAVIYDPFLDRMYAAQKGKGATLNGERITVSTKEKLDSKTYVSVISYNGAPYDLTPTVLQLQQKGVKWINLCTVGIIGGLIAAGQIEASILPGNKIWETGAMALIVEEAGGKCTDLFGSPINFLEHGKMRGHLITNGLLHEEILKLINL